MEHHYQLQTIWTGNKGQGTSSYTQYDRNFETIIPNKQIIHGSSDKAFRGDNLKHNPEEFLLAALSSCHMLWFLHVCANEKIIIESYTDNAVGTMVTDNTGTGRFTNAVLNITIKVTGNIDMDTINGLHTQANRLCFIAQSVNFEIEHTCSITLV